MCGFIVVCYQCYPGFCHHGNINNNRKKKKKEEDVEWLPLGWLVLVWLPRFVYVLGHLKAASWSIAKSTQ